VCTDSVIYCTCYRSTARVTDLQHVSPIYCTCHRSTARVTDLLHVSPIYSTCHRSTARVTELQHVSPNYSTCHRQCFFPNGVIRRLKGLVLRQNYQNFSDLCQKRVQGKLKDDVVPMLVSVSHTSIPQHK